jgi:hypothetical protein
MLTAEELAEYSDQQLAWFDAGGAPTRDAALISRVRDHIRASLCRLNDLSPDDPFWSRTNRRPTAFKAAEWEAQRLAENSASEEARWAVTAFTLLHCQYGAEELLRPLAVKDGGNVRWIVGASEWLTTTSGPDMDDALREALEQLATAEQALDVLRASSDPLDRRAAAIADAVRRGRTMADALRETDAA